MSQDIFNSIENNNIESLKILLERNNDLVFERNEVGYIPLFYICYWGGDLEIVKEFLKYKGDLQVLIQDSYGRTCLHYACINGHLEIAKELLKYGTDQLKLKDNEGISGEEALKDLLSRQN